MFGLVIAVSTPPWEWSFFPGDTVLHDGVWLFAFIVMIVYCRLEMTRYYVTARP
jgi:hypothetical protein